MTLDEQLLAAAFLEGEPALGAWTTWRESVDIDLLEPPQQAVLPQLYRNLSAQGVEDDPILERLRSPYRHTWVANQLLLKSTVTAIAALEREGVDAYLVGDGALALTAYGDLGARKVILPEVLVPARQSVRALRTLREVNWSAVGTPVRRRLRPLIRGRQLLAGPDGQELWLEWRSPAKHPNLTIASPIEVAIQGVRVRIPAVAAQLVVACRAVGPIADPDVRDLADVLAAMRAATDADWEAIGGLALPEVSETTGYLRHALGADFPHAVMS